MFTIDVQTLTLIEAMTLLGVNAVGILLTSLAWRVSHLDVRVAVAYRPPPTMDAEAALAEAHNRRVVTEDARHGEVGRLLAHGCAAILGIVWLMTPQPTNPDVVWWAVCARVSAIGFSVILIEKTCRHLVARYRYDRPWLTRSRLAEHLWPALRLAWWDAEDGARGDEGVGP